MKIRRLILATATALVALSGLTSSMASAQIPMVAARGYNCVGYKASLHEYTHSAMTYTSYTGWMHRVSAWGYTNLVPSGTSITVTTRVNSTHTWAVATLPYSMLYIDSSHGYHYSTSAWVYLGNVGCQVPS